LKTIKLCSKQWEDPGLFLRNLPPNIENLDSNFLHSNYFLEYAKMTPQLPLVNTLKTLKYDENSQISHHDVGTEDQLLQLLTAYPNMVHLQGELELSPLVVYSLSMNKF
jgi:hypothetical protein